MSFSRGKRLLFPEAYLWQEQSNNLIPGYIWYIIHLVFRPGIIRRACEREKTEAKRMERCRGMKGMDETSADAHKEHQKE
jgi:hypothetical protein